MKTRSMNRRQSILNGLCLLFVTSSASLQWGRERSSPSAEVHALCSLCQANASAVRLGRKYLLQHPEYADPEWLAEQVFAHWRPSERRLALTEQDALKKLLNRQIRQDFRRHEVARLDGWVLSKTELRQWALLSLVNA